MKPLHRSTRYPLACSVATLLAASLLASSSQAAPIMWSGATNVWSLNTNWAGNVLPVSNDSLVFDIAGAGGLSLNNDLTNSSFNIAGITFNSGAGAYVIGGSTPATANTGNPFALTGSVVNNSTALQTINDPFSMTSVQTFNTNTGDINLGGVISGAGGGIIKTGSGTLRLNTTNTFTGNVTVNQGTLQLGLTTGAAGALTTTALGMTNAAVTKVTVASGATLDINGNPVNAGMTISGSGTTGQGALINNGGNQGLNQVGSPNITLAANATIGGSGNIALINSNIAADTLDLAGFTLTKAGTNTLYLANTTVTAGTINITGGTLSQTSTASNASAAALSLANTSGVSLNLNNLALSVGSLTGGGTSGGNVVLGTGTLTVGANGTSPAAYAGAISGAGGKLTKTGSGTLTLSASSSYTGGTTVNGGVLALTGGGGFGISNTAIGTGALTITNAAVTTSGAFRIEGNMANTNSRTVSVTTGTLTLQQSEYIKTVNLDGSTVNAPTGAFTGDYLRASAAGLFINASGADSTITGKVDMTFANAVVDVAGSTKLTFSGTITENTGAGSGAKSLTKSSAGTLTLAVANTFSGGTTIRQGAINVQNAGSLGSSTVTLGDASTGAGNTALYLDTSRVGFGGAVVVSNNGSGTATLGTRATVTGSGSGNGFTNVSLARNVVFDSNAADRTDYSNISGTGNITITGTGRTIFTAANSFLGDITVSLGGSSAAATFQSGVATAGNTNFIPDTSSLTVNFTAGNSQAQYRLSSGGETINGLNGDGIIDTNSIAGTLTVGAANGGGTFSGILKDGTSTNTLSFAKTGTGTQILSGTNTYTGITSVNGGTLALAFGAVSSNILGSTSALFLGGGTLNLSGTGTQTVAGLTTTANTNSKIALATSETLTLGALTSAGAGSSLNFNTTTGGANGSAVGTGIVTLTGQTPGTTIRSGFTVTDAGGTGFATVNASNQIIRLTGSTLLPATGATSATDYQIDNNGGGAAAAGSSTLTLTTSAATRTIAVAPTATNGVLTLNTDVVLSNNGWVFGGTGSATYQITGSTGAAGLTSVAAGDAIVFTNYSAGNVTLASPILANGVNTVSFSGPGTTVLSGVNTYTGTTYVNEGTLNLNSAGLGSIRGALNIAPGATVNVTLANALGTSQGTRAGNLAINGGTLNIANTGINSVTSQTTTFNGGTLSGIANSKFDLRNNGAGDASVVTTAASTTATINVPTLGISGGSVTITTAKGITPSGIDLLISSNIVNDAGSGGGGTNLHTLTKAGAGTLSLTGTNTYTGPTTVNGGTLLVSGSINATSSVSITGGTLQTGASNVINDAAGVTLGTSGVAGGTFKTGGFSEYAGTGNGTGAGLGALSLSENSTLDFGAGTSTLWFSSIGTFGAGKILTIDNWSGNPNVGGGTDQFRFTSDPSAALGQISFTGLGGASEVYVSNGGNPYYEIVPVPEPSTTGLLSAGMLIGLVGFRERRRLLTLCRRADSVRAVPGLSAKG